MKLTKIEAKELLGLIRYTVEYFMETKQFPGLHQYTFSKKYDFLEDKVPLYILLRTEQNKKSLIRGIAGVMEPEVSLGELLIQLAVHSAFYDPRAPRLKPFELNEVVFSLHFPSKLKPVSKITERHKQDRFGIKATLRGRTIEVLPYKWTDIPEPIHMKQYLNLNLGVKQRYEDEVEYFTFKVDEYSE